MYGVPASLRKIKGRVFSNSVVGWIRFWEGPQRTPGSLHSKCGTGSADGEWVKFVAHRVAGPRSLTGTSRPVGLIRTGARLSRSYSARDWLSRLRA